MFNIQISISTSAEPHSTTVVKSCLSYPNYIMQYITPQAICSLFLNCII